MRWNCSSCGSKSNLTHVKQITTHLKQAYANCINETCQHRELIDISHNKSIVPPLSKRSTISLIDLIASLPEHEKTKIVNALNLRSI